MAGLEVIAFVIGHITGYHDYDNIQGMRQLAATAFGGATFAILVTGGAALLQMMMGNDMTFIVADSGITGLISGLITSGVLGFAGSYVGYFGGRVVDSIQAEM